MDYAFILDPLPDAQGLQGLERRDDARARRARPRDLRARAGGHLLGRAAARGRASCRSTLKPDDHDWYAAGEPEDRALTDFAAVLMRKDPPFDMEYVYSTYLLEAAEREGARVFNRPRAIRDHNEKIAIARFARVHRADARHARRRRGSTPSSTRIATRS